MPQQRLEEMSGKMSINLFVKDLADSSKGSKSGPLNSNKNTRRLVMLGVGSWFPWQARIR